MTATVPIILTSQSGTCPNCGQLWRASYAQFDIYCPNCGSNLQRLSAVSRIGNAIGISVAFLAFSAFLTVAVSQLFGATLGFVLFGAGALAAIGIGLATYRAARTHRTVARALPRHARGLIRPGFD